MQIRLWFFLLFWGVAVFAQIEERSLSYTRQSAALNPETYFARPVLLVDQPTAGILKSGDVRTSLRLYDQGGVLGRLSVGISKHINFGISYGGLNIIGRQDVLWNKMPGVNMQYRLVEENLRLPAIVLGFDSQGYGPYWDQKEDSAAVRPDVAYESRYSTKSKGFYLVASKSYQSVVHSSLHAGIGYSLENSDGDRDPNLFLGVDIRLARDLSLTCEFDFAMNDDTVRGVNNGKGLLNAGIRWAFSNNIYLQLNAKDLLSEKTSVSGMKRILVMVYHGSVLSR